MILQALTWTELQTPSRRPSGRDWHSAVVDDRGRMLIFGGNLPAIDDELWVLEAALCLDRGLITIRNPVCLPCLWRCSPTQMPQGAQLRAPGPGCIRVRRSPLLRSQKLGAPAWTVALPVLITKFQVTSRFFSPVFRTRGGAMRASARVRDRPAPSFGD